MNKKKYPAGFVPVNFGIAGKVFLVIGTIVFIFGFSDELLNLFNLPFNLFAVGFVCEFIGLYLVFVVPQA